MPDIGPPDQTPSPMEMVFANAYNGATRGTQPPLIHSKLKELRRFIGSVAAVKTAMVPFPVRGAKDLNQKLAEGLDSLDLLAPVIDQTVTLIPVEAIPPNDKGAPVFRTMAHVKATVRIIAGDGSFIDMVGSGHGGDRDDKGGGKASTYAWKDAILKGLTIPHEDMVDTDDEVAAPTGPIVAKAAVVDTKSSVPARVAFVPTIAKDEPTGLAAVIQAIEAAKSEDDLNVIKKAIGDGTYKVTGGDRLQASAAYVRRREELVKK